MFIPRRSGSRGGRRRLEVTSQLRTRSDTGQGWSSREHFPARAGQRIRFFMNNFLEGPQNWEILF